MTERDYTPVAMNPQEELLQLRAMVNKMNEILVWEWSLEREKEYLFHRLRAYYDARTE